MGATAKIGCGDAARLRGSPEVLCELTAVLVRTWVYCTTAYRKCVFGTVTDSPEKQGQILARRERLPESPPVTLLHSKRGFVAVPPSIFERAAARRRLPARVRRAASIPRRRTRRVRERKYDRQQHQRKGPGSSQSQFACCLTDPGIDEDHGVDHDGDAGGALLHV